jgi:hypothetical protein
MNSNTIFDAVWRYEFSAPGFFLLDLGRDHDSHSLRSHMISLKSELSEIALNRTGKRFAYLSMGRFDQQVTTKFHLDGGPSESLLLLGYEPSNVKSRLCLADYSRCAYDRGIEPQRFLAELNPMLKDGEAALSGYITELPQPEVGRFRILLVNNSSLPFTRSNPLGVMHKAEIINPDDSQHRIVNSIMLTATESAMAEKELEKERDFVATQKISPKIYR